MITVACVWWGTKFPIDYVINLKASIERNTTVDHKFICFSDKDVPNIETRILKKGYDGWWNKLQLFDCSHGLSERVIYFDLDTLITGDLDWLFNYNGNFMGIEDVGSVNPALSSCLLIRLLHLSKAVLIPKSISLITVIVQGAKVLSPATLSCLPL